MKEILRKSLMLSFYELKVKNHNTYLGFFWYFLQPLMMFAVLFYVKRFVVGYNIENFIPYLFIGVIMVHFFISSTALMMQAITSNYDLLNSRKIEPEVFLFTKFFMSVWSHVFEAVLVVLILTFLGYQHSFLYIFIIPLYAIFIFGVGCILCVLSTKVFDLTYIWNYFCQILWLILPIYYVSDVINFSLLDLGRALVYDLNKITVNLISVSLMIAFSTCLVGFLIFKSQRNIISERIK